ncbi:hypothetical protein IPV09_09710 [Tessaracoccus sp. SD287]|uniref:DUF5655 domain-containing protein n=1 Tax=Tessaracoccus sp. SD287 TaxID=2782008 RepID=UPI001A962571|nr:DUF5655 domain-containing protein [Tessaracoccus sp. SD287]MBO1031609.1 hypothetical protein [Tessaracoccus sp. SD287]
MGTGELARTPEQFFNGLPEGLRLYRAVEQAVGAIGEVSITVTKSQIAFGRRKRFAYLWRPGQYLRSDVPAVLSIALPYEVASPRFKQVSHPSPTVWMHHLELNLVDEIDEEVRGWLANAFDSAG